MKIRQRLPKAQGLYDPANEHDSCGIGFVAHIKGHKSNEIVRRGLEVLVNMTHRGAESADNKTGDGAGILMQLPDSFFREFGFSLPSPGRYGSGLVFLPKVEKEAQYCIDVLNEQLKSERLELIGYREVPVNSRVIGDIARSNEPYIKQVFVKGDYEQDVLERKLFMARKVSENLTRRKPKVS